MWKIDKVQPLVLSLKSGNLIQGIKLIRENMASKRVKKDVIVIDEKNGLVFDNEAALYKHFSKEVHYLEGEYLKLRDDSKEIAEAEFDQYEHNLSDLLEDPDEIWIDDKTVDGLELRIYLREFEPQKAGEDLFHVAVVYMTDDVPSFVYLHFPTNSIDLVYKYQRGKIIYDRVLHNARKGAIEGDALLEGDELSNGLFEAMMTLRSGDDIPEEEFRDYADFREPSIEEADEIWRSSDTLGNVLVTFVCEYPDEGKEGIWYVVVTLEDAPSNSHALLFSFPTTDESLVDRYRHGENLQAEEVVQEASH